MGDTRTLVALTGGLAAIVLLASGGLAHASSSRPVARTSTPRRSPVPSSSTPKKNAPKKAVRGDVTMGPITHVVTRNGVTTRTTDTRGLTAKQRAAFAPELARGDTSLLTDEQALALENDSVQSARAAQPGASSAQQDFAKRAAQHAAKVMSRKGVPPIPMRAPANPGIDADSTQERGDTDAPQAYVSPPTPINLELARREAAPLAKNIRANGSKYSRQALRDFQAHAGLTVDGGYGPLSASALKYFGVKNPPKALSKPKPGTITIYSPDEPN